MLRKINRAACLSLYPGFPLDYGDGESFFFPEAIHSYILNPDPSGTRIKSIAAANLLCTLLSHIGCHQLIFLGDSTSPWYRHSSSKPAKLAIEYLKASRISKSFDGGIVIDLPEAKQFLKHVYWLTRTNTAVPIIYFMDQQQSFVGSICQYGNIHLSSLNKAADGPIQETIKKENWAAADHC
ncbi:MAG: hypothetical protein JST83_04560 [Bacteroidetes bacterium]|nr:hypothetical protein [Bacteroidota bacterium]